MVLGVFVIVFSILAWLYTPLRNVEQDIPDVEIKLDDEEDAVSEAAMTVQLEEDVTQLPAV
jgi:hypothetical protein